MKILGISAYYHDSATALLIDGKIIAAAQEERFTRKKHDACFPKNAIQYCLNETGLKISDIDYIVYYDKPLIKFERLLETYLSYAPKGLSSFLKSMPIWLKQKLFLKNTLKKELGSLSGLNEKGLPRLMFADHHQSHAVSAFFPSPFKNAAILCMDGVGEWITTSIWLGEENRLIPKWEINFPHSLGLLYSAFTYYTGFEVNSGEYKLMGLSPYGKPKYKDLIYKHLVDIKEDGSFRLNMSYFDYPTGLTMTNKKFNSLFGGKPKNPEISISNKNADIANSIQVVTEEIILKLAKTIKKKLGSDYLCMAGGVALNCVVNGKLLREKIFKDIWIQPAAGDAGCAIGAAYSIWYEYLKMERKNEDILDNYSLGPKYNNQKIELYLKNINAQYENLDDEHLISKAAEALKNQSIIGWFQGRMEFGPRSLGCRSILADPRNFYMRSRINQKIKYRENFRPFAPSIIAEKAAEWFDIDRRSPYMLFTAYVKKEKRIEEEERLSDIDNFDAAVSQISAVTHIDYSSRIQTVDKKINPKFYSLIESFEQITGCPLLVNTSFNIKGEPIVCTPEDAYNCFMRTEMDYLVIENFFLSKKYQPKYQFNDFNPTISVKKNSF